MIPDTLTRTERAIVVLLAEADDVVSSEDIARHIETNAAEERLLVRVRIANIRRKLLAGRSSVWIENVFGEGYRLRFSGPSRVGSGVAVHAVAETRS